MLFFVLALAACGEVRQTHRWPEHRREKDEQIDALAQKATALEARVHKLEMLLEQLKPSQPVPPAPPTPAALPSPGT
jgi:hypothetical protein